MNRDYDIPPNKISQMYEVYEFIELFIYIRKPMVKIIIFSIYCIIKSVIIILIFKSFHGFLI